MMISEMTRPLMRHPSKFSEPVLDEMLRRLNVLLPDRESLILDPFAGVGLVHTLGYNSVGIELEPEWATMHPHTIVGDACDLPFPDQSFDAVVTSPVYGNRMSDSHVAKDSSRRVTYTHTLGRPLHPNNAGQLQWGTGRRGDAYRQLHYRAWNEAYRVLRPGGYILLNVSDHIRAGEQQLVTWWHHAQWVSRGCVTYAKIPIATQRMKFGQNHAARVPNEWLIVLRKL